MFRGVAEFWRRLVRRPGRKVSPEDRELWAMLDDEADRELAGQINEVMRLLEAEGYTVSSRARIFRRLQRRGTG